MAKPVSYGENCVAAALFLQKILNKILIAIDLIFPAFRQTRPVENDGSPLVRPLSLHKDNRSPADCGACVCWKPGDTSVSVKNAITDHVKHNLTQKNQKPYTS